MSENKNLSTAEKASDVTKAISIIVATALALYVAVFKCESNE